VRRFAICVAALVALIACENSTDPLGGFGGNGGGGVVSQAQASGTWNFTLNRTSTLSCPAGSLNNGQVLATNIVAGTDGSVSSVSSSWRDPSGNLRPLSGSVRLTDGFTTLLFSAGSGSGAMELRGTMTPNGGFTGTVTDPAPGSAFVFSGGCEYTAAGIKTG
jgi:hypothetical protein